ncbi:uncharacterized protein LOC135390990 isoform X1 [Ornithodoros turicata]|uniref:uncharacterized protein LOC135390990 isoform X1 n=1 Tax=Ornithodoros turicata TaxID=34597 RepID=UPI003138F302
MTVPVLRMLLPTLFRGTFIVVAVALRVPPARTAGWLFRELLHQRIRPIIRTAAMLSNGDNRASKHNIQDTPPSERTEDTFEVIPVDYQSISVKRRRIDGYDSQDRMTAAARTFLTVRHNSYVFHTEEWKPRGCSMYLPLTQDVMLNMRHIEQVSFENDQFFLADGKGNYAGAKTGNAIHLWRLDPNTRKLYVSRSLLFLREQDYREVQLQLASL